MRRSSGVYTSEFWLNVVAGAICGGSYALGYNIDNSAIFTLLSSASIYTYARYRLKKSALEAWKEVNSVNPETLEKALALAKNIEDELKLKGVNRLIVDQAIQSSIEKLKGIK